MKELLEITLNSFWSFAGVVTILSLVLYYFVNMTVQCWSRFMRLLAIRKHGWPPAHCDADGDPVKL